MRLFRSIGAGVGLLCLVASGPFSCARSPERPHIVLISIDSLRPDRLGLYGHSRDTSPNLDRFASESVVFDNAYSTTSWTLPSHVSMLTGLYPEAHGVVEGKQRVGAEADLLSEVLQSYGYQTLGVVAGPYLRTRFGFNQGWDDYDDYTIRIRGKRATTQGSVTPGQHRRIVEVLDGLEPRPFFLFLHYWDVHYDYNPPEPWRSRFDPDYEGDLDVSFFTSNESIHPEMDARDLEHLLALYDGEIAFTDHYIGLLFEELRRRDLYDDAWIIVTSDHGDEFFEHGQKGHRANLFNTTLKIPLIIKFPESKWGGRRVGEPVSLVDIVPTIYDRLDIDPIGDLNGRNLLPEIERYRSHRSRTVFADLGDTDKTMIAGSWKILSTTYPRSRLRLFDLSKDPQEQEDVFSDHRDQGEEMAETLRVWAELARKQAGQSGGESIEYDDETREALESLGYLD